MTYFCQLAPNGDGGYLATFPDVSEALTEGRRAPKPWPTPPRRWKSPCSAA